MRPYCLLDVFTKRPLAGNGLAVFLDADGLTDAVMHRIAREMRLSETSFIQSPTLEEADYRHRIFTAAGEIPFAGHPSLGSAFAVAHARGLEGDREMTLKQQVLSGVHSIAVRIDGLSGYASMAQGMLHLGQAADSDAAVQVLGLGRGDAHAKLKPRVASTGLPHLLLPLRDPKALAQIDVRWEGLEKLCARAGCQGVYAFALAGPRGAVCARSFPKVTDRAEDPATGSAAGPLAGYLFQEAGVSEWTISQGVEMGRPSTLIAEASATGDGIEVRVSGDVVLLIEGRAYV